MGIIKQILRQQYIEILTLMNTVTLHMLIGYLSVFGYNNLIFLI